MTVAKELLEQRQAGRRVLPRVEASRNPLSQETPVTGPQVLRKEASPLALPWASLLVNICPRRASRPGCSVMFTEQAAVLGAEPALEAASPAASEPVPGGLLLPLP